MSNTLATKDVNVVVRNNSNAPWTVGTFNFAVIHLDDTRLFAPPDTTGSSLDRNPDFVADTTDLGDWACAPTDPDNDKNPVALRPGSAQLHVMLQRELDRASVGAAATLPSMTMHYNIVAGADPGSMIVSLNDSAIADSTFTFRCECSPTPTVPADCQSAELVFTVSSTRRT